MKEGLRTVDRSKPADKSIKEIGYGNIRGSARIRAKQAGQFRESRNNSSANGAEALRRLGYKARTGN